MFLLQLICFLVSVFSEDWKFFSVFLLVIFHSVWWFHKDFFLFFTKTYTSLMTFLEQFDDIRINLTHVLPVLSDLLTNPLDWQPSCQVSSSDDGKKQKEKQKSYNNTKGSLKSFQNKHQKWIMAKHKHQRWLEARNRATATSTGVQFAPISLAKVNVYNTANANSLQSDQMTEPSKSKLEHSTTITKITAGREKTNSVEHEEGKQEKK